MPPNSKSHVIRLTGPGMSALATIRITGPLVHPFLRQHFGREARPGVLVHGEWRDESGQIDDPVVRLAADSSYADITLHGSNWIVQTVMECAIRAGFESTNADADPRAVFPEANGVLQSEILAALPRARTELAARTLLAQSDAWKTLLASRESDAIEACLADDSLSNLLHPPTVAIIGRPNAGKSTLANQLFGSERSIVSELEGTTRDWVGEEANLDGLIVQLLDTPGRRQTDDPIERQAIAQSHAPVAAARIVIILLDAARRFQEQEPLLEGLTDPLLVLNKVDLNPAAVSELKAAGYPVVGMNARRGEGVDLLVAEIHRRLRIGQRAIDAPRRWTSRQRDELLGLLHK